MTDMDDAVKAGMGQYRFSIGEHDGRIKIAIIAALEFERSRIRKLQIWDAKMVNPDTEVYLKMDIDNILGGDD